MMDWFLSAVKRSRIWCACAIALGYALFPGLACVGATEPSRSIEASDVAPSMRAFLQGHCADCHEGEFGEADFAWQSIGDAVTAENFKQWTRVLDRVASGEMPPEDAEQPEDDSVAQFIRQTEAHLIDFQRHRDRQLGRVHARRLTHLQLERSLHDLLGIDVPLAKEMPEETRREGFTTVAEGQSLSHFQLQTHLDVVDAALDEAFRRATTPSDLWKKTFPAEKIVRKNPKRRCREPEMIDGQAVVWSSRLIFYGRLPVTKAKESGWYRFRVRASALKAPSDRGVWCTVRRGFGVSGAPLLHWVGAFEATDQPREWEFETWLPRGEMLEIRPGDTTLKMARFAGGQVGAGEGGPQDVPGVAIDSITMERIHRNGDDDAVRRWLFDDLQVEQPDAQGGRPQLRSQDPQADVARLLVRFANRAFRRPVQAQEIAHYIDASQQAIEEGVPLIDAVRYGYRALLCSPWFMYFQEPPGELSSHALATRLSYFLTAGPPDETLRALADRDALRDPEVLVEQTERLLAGAGAEGFIDRFAAQWLDLAEIDATTPNRRLHRDFDVIVEQSMVDETTAFLTDMLQNDRSVTRLIDSEDTFLNSHLARFYGVDGVEGDDLQLVKLDPESRRGGVLTQGAILKVTANGTTTSPVLRGVWICERLLGREIPPPPESVPAIEPDVRGAKSIREMLAKHRSEASCAACHRRIDPPGFALENFDAAGKWRRHYPRMEGKRVKRGAKIDASYELPSGRGFEDIDGFREVILREPETIAVNVGSQLLTYGTGAPVSIADRQVIEDLVAELQSDDYGFRSLLHAVVTSEPFRKK